MKTSNKCLKKTHASPNVRNKHKKLLFTTLQEVDIIKKCQAKMKKVLDKAYVQLKMNRAAQHAMEIDAKDKHHAQGLDDRMQQLRNSSSGIGYYPGIESIDNT